jgi:hypothetical protein
MIRFGHSIKNQANLAGIFGPHPLLGYLPYGALMSIVAQKVMMALAIIPNCMHFSAVGMSIDAVSNPKTSIAFALRAQESWEILVSKAKAVCKSESNS